MDDKDSKVSFDDEEVSYHRHPGQTINCLPNPALAQQCQHCQKKNHECQEYKYGHHLVDLPTEIPAILKVREQIGKIQGVQ